MVIDQAVKESFRFRNIDEIEHRKQAKVEELEKQEVERSTTEQSMEKEKSSNESIKIS